MPEFEIDDLVDVDTDDMSSDDLGFNDDDMDDN
jgi:hypothetical protein